MTSIISTFEESIDKNQDFEAVLKRLKQVEESQNILGNFSEDMLKEKIFNELAEKVTDKKKIAALENELIDAKERETRFIYLQNQQAKQISELGKQLQSMREICGFD